MEIDLNVFENKEINNDKLEELFVCDRCEKIFFNDVFLQYYIKIIYKSIKINKIILEFLSRKCKILRIEDEFEGKMEERENKRKEDEENY